MKLFYEPNQEQLTRLSVPFICSYSGGKDSTSLVVWIEWLRRSGWLTIPNPKLVISDTGVEFPFLREIATKIMERLRECGWECKEVQPKTREKLYCQIFGRGLPPVALSERRLRWCTRATKIDPMKRFNKTIEGEILQLTGMRWGESATRDAKLLKGGCQAGGECGLPTPGEGKYAAIVNWTDCHVLDWLGGLVSKEVIDRMQDLFSLTANLVDIYAVKRMPVGFLKDRAPEVSMLRFGCIGCPAIQKDKAAIHFEQDNPELKQLRRLYAMWERLRDPRNRVIKEKKGGRKIGPIKMKIRQLEFVTLMDIQEKSGVELVNVKDIAFIKKCWQDKVYPKGWSADDE